jgi:hypothetical protein
MTYNRMQIVQMFEYTVLRKIFRHEREVVAVQGPDFWPTPSTYNKGSEKITDLGVS